MPEDEWRRRDFMDATVALPEGPGWSAIDSLLEARYQRPPDLRISPLVAPSPTSVLQGFCAYRLHHEGKQYWHVVTYGLTDVYGQHLQVDEEEEHSDSTTSIENGPSMFGIELTINIPCGHEDQAFQHQWALSLLHRIARNISGNAKTPRSGQFMQVGFPLNPDAQECCLFHVGFGTSPSLPDVYGSPCGTFQFLHVYGITNDELQSWLRWDGEKAFAVFQHVDPLLITDARRSSWIVTSPDIAQTLQSGAEVEGSSISSVDVEDLEWEVHDDVFRLTVGATSVPLFVDLIGGRLPYRKKLVCRGAAAREVHWIPAGYEEHNDDQMSAGSSQKSVDEMRILVDAENVTVEEGVTKIDIPRVYEDDCSCSSSSNSDCQIVFRKLLIICSEAFVDNLLENVRPVEGIHGILPSFVIRVQQSLVHDEEGRVYVFGQDPEQAQHR